MRSESPSPTAHATRRPAGSPRVHDVSRTPASNPQVHRDLVVTDPPMRGRDVANLNRATHDRLEARGLRGVPTPQHDRFTLAAALAMIEAGYFLGARSDSYLRTFNGRRVATRGLQELIRHPDARTAAQLGRAKARQGQLERGPRYYDELAAKLGIGGHGVAAALAWAEKQVGTIEPPGQPNWGPKIKDWIKLTHYTNPVPWCGCFANAACIAGGVPNGAGWIGYTPTIITHAQRGLGGWTWHDEGRAGDLVVFDTPGGDPAVHVGIVRKRLGEGHYLTVEGNTSSGPGGSQSNGGGVFNRDRISTPAFRMVGFARPPWPA